LRVQRVKLTGSRFSSISPERKRKARRRGQQEESVRGQMNSRQKWDGVWVRCEYWRIKCLFSRSYSKGDFIAE